jgi:hypothetical protein
MAAACGADIVDWLPPHTHTQKDKQKKEFQITKQYHHYTCCSYYFKLIITTADHHEPQ